MAEENDNVPSPPPQSLSDSRRGNRGRIMTSLGSSSSDDDDKSTKEEEEAAVDNAPLPPPSRSTKGATKTTVEDDNDDTIASLTEGLVGVAISSSSYASPPSEAIRNIASLLSSNRYKNIVVLTGAGVSCNAGIPDFRSPGTGLYDNLQKYNLPYPEAVFDLRFYADNPDPFVHLASELWPGLKHSPTITHTFIALLERRGLLLRVYTQNIDMLDVLAGVSEEKMIECHGHFRTSSCIRCSRPFDGDECKRIIVNEKRAPTCLHCKGYVKPDIVFFGESLPPKFHSLVKQDTKRADLLLVMGTSLMVSPVNMIPDMVTRSCRRVLLNRELVGSFTGAGGSRTRTKQHNTSVRRDIFHGGDCDESIRTLCAILGWEEELYELNASTRLEG